MFDGYYWRMRIAQVLIGAIRRYLVPGGHSWKYALRIPVLNKVNYLSLKGAPLFEGEKVIHIGERP